MTIKNKRKNFYKSLKIIKTSAPYKDKVILEDPNGDLIQFKYIPYDYKE